MKKNRTFITRVKTIKNNLTEYYTKYSRNLKKEITDENLVESSAGADLIIALIVIPMSVLSLVKLHANIRMKK